MVTSRIHRASSLRRSLGYALLGLACGQFQPRVAAARTQHVPAEFPTIQQALDAAAVGDTVLVGPGTYTGSGNRDLDFAGKNLVLRASAGAASTVIDCMASPGSPARALFFHSSEDSTAVVEGFTLQNGFVVDHGAVTLADCVFGLNQALWGSGLHCENSRAEVQRCTFLANEGGLEGALAVSTFSTVAVRACTFAFNVASDAEQAGGVGVSRNSSATVQATIVAFSAQGRGVSCDVGSALVLECCDLFLNAGGDWVGCVAGQGGSNGNLAADPFFCDPVVDDLHLRDDSPCLPGHHPGGTPCGLIGAHGMGTCASPIRPSSWSTVKARYR